MSLPADGECGGGRRENAGAMETAAIETVIGVATRGPRRGRGRGGRLTFAGSANYGVPGFTVELESLDDLFG